MVRKGKTLPIVPKGLEMKSATSTAARCLVPFLARASRSRETKANSDVSGYTSSNRSATTMCVYGSPSGA